VKRVNLQYLFDGCDQHGGTWLNPWTLWDDKGRTLYQPWGADVLPNDPKPEPVIPDTTDCYWIGSVWGGRGPDAQGNEAEIDELDAALNRHRLKLVRSRATDADQPKLIRASRIAPAIQGRWQV